MTPESQDVAVRQSAGSASISEAGILIELERIVLLTYIGAVVKIYADRALRIFIKMEVKNELGKLVAC